MADEQGDDLRPGGRSFAALVASVAVAALVLQYGLVIAGALDTVGPARATARYFSYFTILSNTLVALTAGLAATGARGRAARFFARPAVRAGVGLYIVVTCGVYFFVLRHLWRPRGLQWWADVGLHYAVPILYLVWWTCAIGHGRLTRRDVPVWLLFPLAYLVWTFTRGAWAGEYPYPFVDVGALGVAAALRNALVLLAAFLTLGAAVLWVDRAFGRRESPPPLRLQPAPRPR